MPSILGANTLSTGYEVANSLRFDKPSDSYLAKTFSSAGSTRKFTFSTWLKGHDTAVHGSTYFFVGNINGSSNIDAIGITDSGVQISINSATEGSLNSTALFKDLTAWYHFVIGVDTTQSTASNRVKVYINGTQLTDWDTETYPSQNYDFTGINSTEAHNVSYSDSEHNGYLCETVFIDGTQYAASDFGEFDEDSPTIWKPKKVSDLTFGQNGFYLEYKQTGTSANSSGLGADTSGNDHHFSVNGLAAIDQSTDTCTNNFATLNPMDVTRLSNVGNTFSEGNLVVTDGSSNYLVANGSIAVEAGKWYFEVKMIESTASHVASGVMVVNLDEDDKTDGAANGNHGWLYATNGQKRNGGTSSNYGDAYTQNDIIGVALDMDNKAIYFSKNGTFQASGDPTSGASKTNAAYTNLAGTITAQVYDGQGSESHEFSMNFGSPHHAVSSGNSDANGYGNFEYAVPSGYFALCTKNLAEFG